MFKRQRAVTRDDILADCSDNFKSRDADRPLSQPHPNATVTRLRLMIPLVGLGQATRSIQHAPKSIRQLIPPFSTARRFASSSSPQPPPPVRRSRRWLRGLTVVVVLGGGVYAYDKQFNASALSRSIRTGWIGCVLVLLLRTQLTRPSLLCTVDCEHGDWGFVNDAFLMRRCRYRQAQLLS